MKDRSLKNSDDWKTPDYLYTELNNEFNFTFDPCPFKHDISLDINTFGEFVSTKCGMHDSMVCIFRNGTGYLDL